MWERRRNLRPTHPEITGQELEMMPVTPRTVRVLRRNIQRRLGGHVVAEITADDTPYRLRRFGNVVTVSTGGAEQTQYTITKLGRTREIGKSQHRKPSGPLVERTEDGTRLSDAAWQMFQDTWASSQDRSDIAALTGLPEISEGEVRRVIQHIKTGK